MAMRVCFRAGLGLSLPTPDAFCGRLQKSLAELRGTASFQASISIRSLIAFPQSGLAVNDRFGKSRNHLLRLYLAAI